MYQEGISLTGENPLLIQEGGRALKKNIAQRPLKGADGEAVNKLANWTNIRGSGSLPAGVSPSPREC